MLVPVVARTASRHRTQRRNTAASDEPVAAVGSRQARTAQTRRGLSPMQDATGTCGGLTCRLPSDQSKTLVAMIRRGEARHDYRGTGL